VRFIKCPILTGDGYDVVLEVLLGFCAVDIPFSEAA